MDNPADAFRLLLLPVILAIGPLLFASDRFRDRFVGHWYEQLLIIKTGLANRAQAQLESIRKEIDEILGSQGIVPGADTRNPLLLKLPLLKYVEISNALSKFDSNLRRAEGFTRPLYWSCVLFEAGLILLQFYLLFGEPVILAKVAKLKTAGFILCAIGVVLGFGSYSISRHFKERLIQATKLSKE